MPVMERLNSRDVKELAKKIEEQFGFSDLKSLGYVYYKNNKGKIYVMHEKVDEMDLEKVRIDILGLYFMHQNDHGNLRLSIEGSQVLGPLATKNIVEFNEEQIKQWMKGEDMDAKDETSDFLIVKFRNWFCGCTKVKQHKYMNFVPKARWILAD